MIRKFIHVENPVSISRTFEYPENEYHSLSYYVLGGIDVTGKAVACDADIEFDPPESFTDGSFMGTPGYDPRIGGFDIAETLGINSFREAMENSVKTNPVPDSSVSSD